jgi:hypothetical protein
MGAVYAPCMRKDGRVEDKVLEPTRRKEEVSGTCASVTRGNDAAAHSGSTSVDTHVLHVPTL